jgi:hypothetical protein
VADKRHTYSIRLDWTGNQGTGTSAYRAYSRAHEISAQGKTTIAGSSDPMFRGDAARWNPAELLIAALSACHRLWYLHLCADAGIVVVHILVIASEHDNLELPPPDLLVMRLRSNRARKFYPLWPTPLRRVQLLPLRPELKLELC